MLALLDETVHQAASSNRYLHGDSSDRLPLRLIAAVRGNPIIPAIHRSYLVHSPEYCRDCCGLASGHHGDSYEMDGVVN